MLATSRPQPTRHSGCRCCCCCKDQRKKKKRETGRKKEESVPQETKSVGPLLCRILLYVCCLPAWMNGCTSCQQQQQEKKEGRKEGTKKKRLQRYQGHGQLRQQTRRGLVRSRPPTESCDTEQTRRTPTTTHVSGLMGRDASMYARKSTKRDWRAECAASRFFFAFCSPRTRAGFLLETTFVKQRERERERDVAFLQHYPVRGSVIHKKPNAFCMDSFDSVGFPLFRNHFPNRRRTQKCVMSLSHIPTTATAITTDGSRGTTKMVRARRNGIYTYICIHSRYSREWNTPFPHTHTNTDKVRQIECTDTSMNTCRTVPRRRQ